MPSHRKDSLPSLDLEPEWNSPRLCPKMLQPGTCHSETRNTFIQARVRWPVNSDPLVQFSGWALQEALRLRKVYRYSDGDLHWKRECSVGKREVNLGWNSGSTKPQLTVQELLEPQRLSRVALSCFQSPAGTGALHHSIVYSPSWAT